MRAVAARGRQSQLKKAGLRPDCARVEAKAVRRLHRNALVSKPNRLTGYRNNKTNERKAKH